ncbi:MAG: precorrin-3B C(17)-methyltransferase [Proteobacteria bacterium]|nr:precorrin-3B C(17)-methyltransferase [Pseudomonadota bacterium]
MSVVAEKDKDGRHNGSDSGGKVFVVGTGPGDISQITPAAKKAIEESTVIVGYKLYVDLIAPLIKDQRLCTSGMTAEVERCKEALEIAYTGETVSVVSSGDPGIYGMAGLVLELNRKYGLEVEIVPGLSAVSAAAARAGAPLMHDFAVISLSDLLTPWEVIEKRLQCAAEGDFVIALYNPKSKKRVEQIEKAREIILQSRKGSTPVSVVTNACREGESVIISDLENFTGEKIGMLTVVIIGNSQTVSEDGRMITPRGYETKYADSF